MKKITLWLFALFSCWQISAQVSGYSFSQEIGTFTENSASATAIAGVRADTFLSTAQPIGFDFAYDGGGLAKGGLGTLYIDGKKVGEGRIDRTQPGIFSADETVDVGIDLATPVVERIGAEAKSKFNGSIPKLVVEIK